MLAGARTDWRQVTGRAEHLLLWCLDLGDQHGAWRAGYYALGYAPNEELFQSGFVARAHHDKVGSPLLGMLHDHVLGIAFRADAVGVNPLALKLGDGMGYSICGNVVRTVLYIRDVASAVQQLQHGWMNVFSDSDDAECRLLRPTN